MSSQISHSRANSTMEMIIYVKYPHKSYIPSLITNLNPSNRTRGGPTSTAPPPVIICEDFRMKPSFTLSLLKKDISRRMSIPFSQISFSNLPSSSSSSFSSALSSSNNKTDMNNNNKNKDEDNKTISQIGILPDTTLELNTKEKIVLAILRMHLKLVKILIVDPDTKIRDIKEILVDAPALREMGEKPLSMALKRPWPTPGTMWGFDEDKRVGECMTDEQMAMGGVTFTVGDLRYADREVEELPA